MSMKIPPRSPELLKLTVRKIDAGSSSKEQTQQINETQQQGSALEQFRKDVKLK